MLNTIKYDGKTKLNSEKAGRFTETSRFNESNITLEKRSKDRLF